MNEEMIHIFYNGEILTFDQGNSKVNAMAIFQDKILTIGMEVEVRREVEKFLKSYNRTHPNKIKVQETDLGGTCIVPGFIDAHMHPGLYIIFKTQLDLSGVRSYAELEDILKKEDQRLEPGKWILGLKLMEETFKDPVERRFPNRYDLDKMCSSRPILIFRYDGHICVVNSAVLEIIGINATTLKKFTSISGEIKVDSGGNPTGIFTEGAMSLILDKMPSPDIQQLQEAAKKVSTELASFGITTCGGIIQAGEEGPAGKAGAIELALIEALIREDLLEQDYVFYIITDKPKKLKRLRKSISKLNKEPNRFVVGGIKLFADGTFGASTAYMFEPFADSPNGTCGFMVHEKEELYKLAKETFELGFQIACHTIGDKANRIVVDMFQDLLKGFEGKARQCRIEHASQLTREVITDIADLGLILVCQPAFINSEYTWLEKRLGPKRIRYTYPFRSLIDAGVLIAGASDAPVESANVFKAIQACVTRNGFVVEEVIPTIEALRMFTINAAYALGQETIKGSLEKGKLADFLILKQNPISLPSEQLGMIQILTTYHRGKPIYLAE